MTDQSQTTDILVASGKIYRVCADCGDLVRVNKPIFGSIHLCTTEEERQKYPCEIAARVARNLAALMNARKV